MVPTRMLCHLLLSYIRCDSTELLNASKKSSGTKAKQSITRMKSNGFTLLELVITILLIAILSAFAVPRLLSTPEYSAQSLADQVISHLQQAQVQALNHRSGSYCVGFTSTKYGLPSNCGTGLANSDTSFDLPRATAVSLGGSNIFQVNFDFLGKPVGGNCNGGCQIQITAAETIQVCIEREGYVHEC